MCGIIGYTGKNNAKKVVISGLKNLEYRGYDSAGIAMVENNQLSLYKSKGKIINLEEKLKENTNVATTAIGHTRWATHGEPNEQNAHPHQCGHVTLVHNGIIENFQSIKENLLKEGVVFQTQTDTEVACAYINYLYEKEKHLNKLEILKEACQTFRGSYAFGIIFDDEKDIIYATRKNSPLIIGISNEGNYIASDVSAILDFTNQYILLDQNEFAKIAKDAVSIYQDNLEPISKEICIAKWDATQYKKNGYEHYMLKEMLEQPKVVTSVFERYLKKLPSFALKNYTNLHIVACGSAMHAGLIGKYLFETYANLPVTVEVASEYRYKNMLLTPSTLVIIISQSGETADSLAALKMAKQSGATTLGIVNAVGSSIAREADFCIYTQAGPEIAVATTKGYTTQVATLATLVLQYLKDTNQLSTSLEKQLQQEIQSLETTMLDVLSHSEIYKNIASKIYQYNDIFFIGRGIDYALCMEGSLKLKEISYIHSEAYPAGELKHGTISLVEDGTPIIAIATNDTLYEKTVSNALETKARGASLFFITTDSHPQETFATLSIHLPKRTDFIEPILVICALQEIAYETAKLKNCDIDKPKNLAKSVTVE